MCLEWLYSPAGWLDPWVYLGFALNYLDPTFFDDYYKSARLPWILTLLVRIIFYLRLRQTI